MDMWDRYKDELLWALTGEVYGQSLFQSAADCIGDADLAHKLGRLAALEGVVLACLEPVAARYGLEYDKEPHVERGRLQGRALAERSWAESMQIFYRDADDDIARMRDLLALAPDEDREVLEFLVAHEVALQDFMAGELSGSDTSLDAVEALLR